jgi:hypothetical protein
VGEAQSDPAAAELAAFVSALTQDHLHLFDPADRDTLTEMLRRARELERAGGRRPRGQANPEATREREAITRMVLSLLDRFPASREIALTDSGGAGVPRDPVALPGDSGAAIFTVRNGGGGSHYRVVRLDFETSGPRKPTVFGLDKPGTYRFLVSLANVPIGRTTMMVAVQRAGEPSRMVPVELLTPAPGRLRVTVLSDDDGRPAPSMVRLVWKTDGRERRLPNAVRFEPQFDTLGNPGSERPANLPGQPRTNWWCIRGPFETTLPAGAWEITVRRGVEHVPVTETFEIAEGKELQRTYRPKRWVDMRKHGWYSGDDHVHGRILSDEDATNLLDWIRAEDIHLANVVKMGDISRTFFEQRGFGREFRVQQGDYVLSPGQECPRTHDELGHTISMNIRSMVRDTDRYFLYDWVFDRVHEQGGLAGYCHVLSDSFFVHRDMSMNVPRGKVDFVELMQFGQLGTDLYYEFLNLGFALTASAGSDVPWGGTVGEVRVYVHTGPQREPFSPDAWFEAMGKGRTFVSNGPMLDFRVDDAWPGDELRVSGDRKVRVRARAWGRAGHMVPTKLEIIRHGEVVNSTGSVDGKREELRLDFELDAGRGFWIAARAEGSDQSSAFTTPVYVVRAPFRFWKADAVEGLIARRLGNLDEVERLVAEARETTRDARSGPPLSEMQLLARIQLARQGDALLERVQGARAIYEDLRKTLARERSAAAR